MVLVMRATAMRGAPAVSRLASLGHEVDAMVRNFKGVKSFLYKQLAEIKL